MPKSLKNYNAIQGELKIDNDKLLFYGKAHSDIWDSMSIHISIYGTKNKIESIKTNVYPIFQYEMPDFLNGMVKALKTGKIKCSMCDDYKGENFYENLKSYQGSYTQTPPSTIPY